MRTTKNSKYKTRFYKKRLYKKKCIYIWNFKKSIFFNVYCRNFFYLRHYLIKKREVRKKKIILNKIKRWFFLKVLRIFIATTPRNFFLSLHKVDGSVLFCTSSGMHSFKGKRKLNYTTGVELGRFLLTQFKKKKKSYFLFIYFSGLQRFRLAILKGLRPKTFRWLFRIRFFFDHCYIPHNGLTLPKKRRKKRRGGKNLRRRKSKLFIKNNLSLNLTAK